MIYYFLVALCVLASSASQLLLKKSALREYDSPVLEILNWRVIVAYGIFFASLVVNIFAMSQGVQLKDMPVLESLGYVFVPLLSAMVLKEHLSLRTLVAIVLVMAGVFVFYL